MSGPFLATFDAPPMQPPDGWPLPMWFAWAAFWVGDKGIPQPPTEVLRVTPPGCIVASDGAGKVRGAHLFMVRHLRRAVGGSTVEVAPVGGPMSWGPPPKGWRWTKAVPVADLAP